MKKLYFPFLLVVFFSLQATAQEWGTTISRTETRNDAGALGKSGFYDTDSPINYPAGASSYWHLLDVRHQNTTNNYAMQFAGSFFDQNVWVRKTSNNASQPWSKFILEANGRVGIRTNTPSDILDVDFTNTEPKNLTVFSSITNPVYLPVGGLRFSWYKNNLAEIQMVRGGSFDDGLGLSFHTSSSTASTEERMRIDRSGKVGIGTASPTSQLTVKPSGGNGGILIGELSNGSTYLAMEVSGAQDGYSHLQSVKKSGTDYGVLALNKSGGNVGIGTSTPTEKLSVNGNIRSKEVKVETANWPDYVFKKDYDLMPLSQVKTFIDKNHHLPEIPSAADVEKNGISLGEMNRLLTKKLEELTLHLIEKDEELKQMKSAQDKLQLKQLALENLIKNKLNRTK